MGTRTILWDQGFGLATSRADCLLRRRRWPCLAWPCLAMSGFTKGRTIIERVCNDLNRGQPSKNPLPDSPILVLDGTEQCLEGFAGPAWMSRAARGGSVETGKSSTSKTSQVCGSLVVLGARSLRSAGRDMRACDRRKGGRRSVYLRRVASLSVRLSGRMKGPTRPAKSRRRVVVVVE